MTRSFLWLWQHHFIHENIFTYPKLWLAKKLWNYVLSNFIGRYYASTLKKWKMYFAILLWHCRIPLNAYINRCGSLLNRLIFPTTHINMYNNKANLRDLIAETGLVILLKLDLNHRFFSPCDLEIWWMTPKNNRAPLLCYFKLCASFLSHWWIQTGVTVQKRLIWVKIDNFFSRVTLKFEGWPSKTIGHLFYATSSFVQHFVAIDEFKLELQSGNA